MNNLMRLAPVLLLAGLTGLAFTATRAESRDGDEAEDQDVVELEEAKVFIEWNSTANDFGIHFFWDGEPWSEMTVRGETGRRILEVEPMRNLRKHGLTEGFFESAEPPAEEFSMEEFFERFPEGEYEFSGETLEGDDLVGEADFTHTLPAPPTNLSPAGGEMVDHTGFTVSFDAVMEDTEGNAIDIAFYEIIVEKLDDEPILQTFTVVLRPGVTSIAVSGDFLEPDTEYKFEVIAAEEGGNKTITESGTFSTDAP